MKRTLLTLATVATMAATMVSCEKEIVLNPVTQGMLPGVFSVAEGKQVRFSIGNLQFCPTYGGEANKPVWQFASSQYSTVGNGNSQISASNTGWIDLFGWGTSGWQSGAVAYRPYATNLRDNDYWPGNASTNNLTGDYAQADWGMNNAITNGGNVPGAWRVLTNEEWNYLFYERNMAQYKYGVGNIAGKQGLILLPDNWSMPTGDTSLHFYYGLETGAGSYSLNTYTYDQWDKMEKAGAVFLPAAGFRSGTSVSGNGAYGRYWSSTQQRPGCAYGLSFSSTQLEPQGYNYRHFGRSVRLVHDI